MIMKSEGQSTSSALFLYDSNKGKQRNILNLHKTLVVFILEDV